MIRNAPKESEDMCGELSLVEISSLYLFSPNTFVETPSGHRPKSAPQSSDKKEMNDFINIRTVLRLQNLKINMLN